MAPDPWLGPAMRVWRSQAYSGRLTRLTRCSRVPQVTARARGEEEEKPAHRRLTMSLHSVAAWASAARMGCSLRGPERRSSPPTSLSTLR